MKERPTRVSIFEKDILHAHLLSWGLGLQSTVMILKALEDEMPRPDAIIFADPHYERAGSYENLDKMRPMIEKAGIPFHVVSAGDIREEGISSGRTELPYFANPSRYETIEGKLKLHLSDVKKKFYKQRKKDKGNQLPLFDIERDLEKVLHDAATEFGKKVERNEIKSGWLNLDTTQIGRQCTLKYKIKPVTDCARQHYGASAKTPIGQWLGITTDEWHRMRKSRIKASVLMYPLIDLQMSRDDCEIYLLEKGYPVPPKSACIACPYHSDKTWLEMTDAEIEDVIAFEEGANQMIANTEALRYLPYFANGVRVHPSMQWIEERPFEKSKGNENEGSPCVGEAGCFL